MDSTKIDTQSIPPPVIKDLHHRMVVIRLFEEHIREALFRNEIKTPCHLYLGEEAVAAGVCVNLTEQDYIFSNHRSHGHYIAKGGDLNKLMAEIYGRETGCSRGRGGSMHVSAPEVSLLGTAAMVSAGIPMGVGAALGCKLQNNGKISVPFFGDGATEEGVFHESLLFSSFHKLPILFIIENNLISTHLPLVDRQNSTNLGRFANSYNIPVMEVDGNDAFSVYTASKKAIEYIRAGNGPYVLECKVNRWIGHVGPNWDYNIGFRTKELVDSYLKNDPIKKIEEFAIQNNIMTKNDIDKIHSDTKERVESAYKFALQSDYPNPNELEKYVFYENKY
ncbi:MAG: thiamine pyrophosphate-dependent dehydrogenase E1 component subunit alpha [Candidatus Thorarchaeota archaeon]